METTVAVPVTTGKSAQATGEAVQASVKALTPPSAEMAAQFLREVAWDERLTAYVYHPAPGAAPEWITQVSHVYNFLRGAPDMFIVKLRELQQWVGEVLGDEEVAVEIGVLLERLPEEDENDICNRAWLESDTERQAVARIKANAQIAALATARTQLREGVTRLLGERIAQCAAVLEISED